MNLDDLDWERQRAFLAVLRSGSLSGAARSLGLAQPTVRRRIADLEAALGTALFTRTPAGLSPTETARTLAGHAEAMAHAAAAFARTASAEANAVGGVVRISASEVVAVEVLPPILARLQAAHPALVFALSPSNRTEDVLRREADIAVRMVAPRQEALVAKRIGAIRLGLFAHPDRIARTGAPATLDQVVGFGMIGPEQDGISLRAVRAAGLVADLGGIAFRSDNDLAQLAAIRAGLGIGVTHVQIGRRDGLTHILPDAFALPLETWVVAHEDLRGVARVRATFDALVDGLLAYAALTA